MGIIVHLSIVKKLTAIRTLGIICAFITVIKTRLAGKRKVFFVVSNRTDIITCTVGYHEIGSVILAPFFFQNEINDFQEVEVIA